MKNKAKKTFTPAKQNFLLRVPANATGDRFIHQLKTYMNGDSYSIKKRYTGTRHSKNAGHTRKVDAISVRLYVNAKGDNGERNILSPHSLIAVSGLMAENFELRRKLNSIQGLIDSK